MSCLRIASLKKDLGTERNAGISGRLYIHMSKEGRNGGHLACMISTLHLSCDLDPAYFLCESESVADNYYSMYFGTVKAQKTTLPQRLLAPTLISPHIHAVYDVISSPSTSIPPLFAIISK